jgi:CHAT domain-containing protein
VNTVWVDRFRQSDLEHLLFRGEHPLLGRDEPGSEPWKAALTTACAVVAERLMDPLAESLRALGFEQAVLCPAGHLGLLPLSVVADRALFTATPSARLLQSSITRSGERRDLLPSFLGVGTGAPGQPLPFAAREGGAAGVHFPEGQRRLLLDGSAIRRAVVPGMAGASHLHFACHGTFDPVEPLQSALHLAEGDRITLRDILDNSPDLSAARLAVLSACRSGLAEYQNTPDEALGFPAVLLQAGIPAVVGTLWPVADLSSALLMRRFYEIHLGERQPAGEALRSAQRWLWDATTAELGLADHAEELLVTARSSAERATAYYMLRRARSRPAPVCPPLLLGGVLSDGGSGPGGSRQSGSVAVAILMLNGPARGHRRRF